MANKQLERMRTLHVVGAPGEPGEGPDYREPWTAGPVPDRNDGSYEIRDATGLAVVEFYGSEVMEDDEPELARRIAACVNVCAGVPVDELERFGSLFVSGDAKVSP